MKKSLILLNCLLIGTALLLQSCDKDDDENMDENPEFIATDDTFSDWKNWSLDATTEGADPSLGPAHAGNDSTVTRNIYYKNGVAPSNGVYPIGAVIVKHSHNPAGTVAEYTAMVKRGNDFSPTGGDWEYFMLNPDGSIATHPDSGDKMRGASLMNGMCMACHAGANTDYVFTKN